MTASTGSVRFEVSVNGQVVATSGIDGYGVLTTILSWGLRDPDRVPEHVQADPDYDPAEWLAEDLRLDVGGLAARGHLKWADRDLSVGDEVRIRVLPPGPVDDAVESPR